MSYLLQTKEHVDLGNRSAETGDVIVSGVLRAAYRMAKDGSRRRIKDKAQFKVLVDRVREHLAEEATKTTEAEERAAADKLQPETIAEDLKAVARPKMSPATLALLVGGMSMLGSRPLLSRPSR